MPIYAMVLTLEGDSREEAFERIAGEVGPEPANAHFIGQAYEIEPDYDHNSRDVAQRLIAADLMTGVNERELGDPRKA